MRARSCPCDRVVEQLLDLGVNGGDRSRLEPRGLDEQRITQLPLRDLLVRAVLQPHRALSRVMAEEAVGDALEERRAATLPRTGDGGLRGLGDGTDVHPVDLFGRHAVGERASRSANRPSRACSPS